MNEKTKESKFLEAINRYAERQKAMISEEVEEYKKQKIEQATEAGLKDAYELIQSEVERRKAAIVTEYSQKEDQLRRELYHERGVIADEVFKKAEEALLTFTFSKEYRDWLLRSASEIAAVAASADCDIHLRQVDLIFADEIKNIIPQAQLTPDDSISIGGLKASCISLNILIDDTLDSRLISQREWFTENSGLKVVEI